MKVKPCFVVGEKTEAFVTHLGFKVQLQVLRCFFVAAVYTIYTGGHRTSKATTLHEANTCLLQHVLEILWLFEFIAEEDGSALSEGMFELKPLNLVLVVLYGVPDNGSSYVL